jgi:hypothetical protein
VPLTIAVHLAGAATITSEASWWAFAYVAVFSMWLGFFAWYRGLALGGTVRVSQVQLIQPVFWVCCLPCRLLGRNGWTPSRWALACLSSPPLYPVGRRMPIRATPPAHHPKERPLNNHEEPPPPPTAPGCWPRAPHKMNPSVIREILKVTEKPGIISFAGGLPSPKTFPVAEFDAGGLRQRVLTQDQPQAALQYAASEGFGPLRELGGRHAALKKQGMDVHGDQVLITTGSQQGLDLVAKVLIDAGSEACWWSPPPTWARCMAFTPMEPRHCQRRHRR